MSFGLDTNGFTIPGQDDILTDINAREKALFGDSWDVSADSPEGQLNGVVAAKLSELWEVAQAVYNAATVDGAIGAQLDQLLQLTGVTRLGQEFSKVSEVLVGNNATSVPAGTQFSIAATGAVFATDSTVSIATVSAWVASTTYAQGALVSHDSGKLYSCAIAGISNSSGGPTGTGTAIVDGTVTWRYVATASAAVSVSCTAVSAGPVVGAAGTITTIVTPIGGLNSVVNPLDAVEGRNVETDAAARIRRAALLRNEGLGSVDSIRAKVLTVADVLQAIVFENPTDVTDGNGVPPHAFETLVQGGIDQSIADAIWAAKPAGIRTYGSTTDSVLDTAGNAHNVSFSRPSGVNIYVSVSLTYDHSFGAYGGDAAVKQALADYGNKFKIGQSVNRNLLFGPIETVAGILDVTVLTLGTSPSPSGTSNISISTRQLALFDTSRIVVTST